MEDMAMVVVGKQFVAEYKSMVDRNCKRNDEESQKQRGQYKARTCNRKGSMACVKKMQGGSQERNGEMPTYSHSLWHKSWKSLFLDSFKAMGCRIRIRIRISDAFSR
jgi:hypothetical protein